MILETTAKASQQYKVMPIMISLLLAGFIGMFSETALNIALTDLMKELHITAATVQWLTTGYLLVLGILVPVSGLLLQWFTTRQLFTVSLIFSILGTFIAALAPSFPFLLAARIVQALGIGLLLPLMFNTILMIFPPHKRGLSNGNDRSCHYVRARHRPNFLRIGSGASQLALDFLDLSSIPCAGACFRYRIYAKCI